MGEAGINLGVRNAFWTREGTNAEASVLVRHTREENYCAELYAVEQRYTLPAPPPPHPAPGFVNLF
jgi:hypothetical protein